MDFFLQQTVNGLVLGSVYSLYACGFGLVMANLGIFHVAHAAVFTWGAVLAWHFTAELGWPMLLALPVVAVAAGLLNVLAYFVLIRHLLRRTDSTLVAFISSMAGLIILTDTAYRLLGGEAKRIPAEAFPTSAIRIGPVQLSSLNLTVFVLAVGIVAILTWLLAATKTGREIRTVAFDRRTAALLGISVDRVSSIVFFISGSLAGLASCFVATAFNVVDADLGPSYLIIALAALVVGGFGSMTGMLVGGTLIGLASAYATGFLNSSYRDLVVFALLLLFLVVRPQGLVRGHAELSRA